MVDLSGDVTQTSVLRAVGVHGPITRTDLARRLGVSAGTITGVTRELIEFGLLESVGKVQGDGRGRPAELLALAAGSAQTVGAKVTDTQVIGMVADLIGNVLGEFVEPFDPRVDDPCASLEKILASHMGDGPGPFLGVGLGVPGMVDSLGGGTVTAPTLGWSGLAVGAALQEQLGLPVIVENDVHTLSVAESLYGRGREIDDFLTVTIGRGIGLGIVAGGELHRGARGGAAELGHTQVLTDGPHCECGRRGCLESLASEPALVRSARSAGLIDLDAGIVALRELARAGEPNARAIFLDAGHHLGRSVAMVVNLLAPELVIVSGEGTDSWDLMEPGFTATYTEGRLPFHADVPVVMDPWEDLNWARGAVSLLTRTLFSPSSGDSVERWVRSRLAPANDTHRLEVGADGR
ncbi:MAG: ROK family transcriptional regulator [Nitriliruptoraceae bacterium]